MSVRTAPAPHDCRRSVRIRTLRHAEDGPLRQVYAGLSQRSRFLRYHRVTPALPSSTVAALVDIRPGHHVAFAAEIGGEPVGIVRWIRLPGAPTHAELAAEVVDAVQGCGLGRQLAAAAARSALAVGVEWFRLWVHSGNVALRQRLRAVNAAVAVDDPDEFLLPVTALLPGQARPDLHDNSCAVTNLGRPGQRPADQGVGWWHTASRLMPCGSLTKAP